MSQLNLYRAENLLVLKLLCMSIAVCRQNEKEPWLCFPLKEINDLAGMQTLQLRTDQLGYVTV